MFSRPIPLVWPLTLAAVATLSTARGDSVETRLRNEAPRVMKFLTDHHYQTVGVLNFAVKKGDRPATFDAGTLNGGMAVRLENALMLLNDAAHPIAIVHSVGSSHSGAYNSAQRQTLFQREYPLAWGNQKKRPDALVTGEVIVSKDMKSLDVIIQAVDRKDPERLADVIRLKNIPVDRNVLASIGQSFAVSRGVGHRLSRDADTAASNDAAKRDETGVSPLNDSDDPVKLQIFYDDKPVALESDASNPGEVKIRRAKTADPKEGQKLKFIIKNISKETVGVVLAVNDKNTIFQEDLVTKPIAECTKWILGPGESYTIAGFYMTDDGKDVRAFKVLSDEESAKAAGAPGLKGLFSMTVFRPVPRTDLDVAAHKSPSDAGDLSRSPRRTTTARSLAEAQAALRSTTHVSASKGRLVAAHVAQHPSQTARRVSQKGGRGLVVEDAKSTTGSKLNRVATPFDPSPAMCLFIRYYAGPITGPAS
jgi:hypothetical protein